MKEGSIIFIVVFWMFVVKNFLGAYIKHKKQVENVVSNGKTAMATVIDYVKFRTCDRYANVSFFCYPVLEFYINNTKFIHIYCNDNGVRKNIVKKDYPIGSTVKIYYIDSDEDIIQLDWEGKIFLNEYYPKLGIIKGKKVFMSYNVDQKITFESNNTYENGIPNTKIRKNDIYIENSSELESSKKTCIAIISYMTLIAALVIIASIKFIA